MRKTELVFVPTPGMGHLLSTVQLAKLIVGRNDGVSVLILVMNLPLQASAVSAYIESQSRDADPTKLTFLTLPGLANPPDPSSTKNFFSDFVDLCKPLVRRAVEDRVGSGRPRPAGFVLDMFCVTMIDVANELGVPAYVFFTSGANFLSLVFHLQGLADDDGVDIPDKFSDPNLELHVPGFRKPVPSKVLPGVALDKDGGSDMLVGITRRFRECKGILTNTFEELEPLAIRALLEDAKVPTVYPVGPILDLDSRGRSGPGSGSGHDGGDRRDDATMAWLDEQPPSSVVFLCFGSLGSFAEEEVKEIARGLELSGHRFLWALRRPPPKGKVAMPSQDETFSDALPEGFLDRVGPRGRIIGWAPQVAVLAHRAVGGFVSHCGWNSTLESLWFGVPVATWPVYAEQQVNAFELVEELGLAVEVRMDYRRDWRDVGGAAANVLVTAEEVERGVNRLMSMDEATRDKVREVGHKGRTALRDGGSSLRWLTRFIDDVLDYDDNNVNKP